MDLTFRPAVDADFSAVVNLLNEMHTDDAPIRIDDAQTSATWAKMLSDEHRQIVVVFANTPTIERAVATADIVLVPNLTHGARPWAIVENIVVASDYRRLGIGRALMSYIVEDVQKRNCYKVQLISNEHRVAAHSLYVTTGFEAPVRGFRRYLD